MSERVEQTFRCSQKRCRGEALARIVVRDERRVLVVNGGRYGHTSSLKQTLFDAAERIRHGADTSLLQKVNPDVLERYAARAVDEPQQIERQVYPIPDYVESLQGPTPLLRSKIDAVCPRCHRPARLEMAFRADGVCGVLMSSA